MTILWEEDCKESRENIKIWIKEERSAIINNAEDLEDAVRWHNSKTLFWHVKKLKSRPNNQSVLVSFEGWKRAIINDKKRIKERSIKHFENVLNHDKVTKNEIRKEWNTFKDLWSEEKFIFWGRTRNSYKSVEK